MSRRLSAVLVLLGLSGCGGGAEPAPTPTAVSPAPAGRPATPARAQLELSLQAPPGSSLTFGDSAPLELPGTVALEVLPEESSPVRGRLNLNALSEALRIPSAVRDSLRGDEQGIWVEVEGSYSVVGGADAALELSLDETSLVALLEEGALELTDPDGRIRLSLRLR